MKDGRTHLAHKAEHAVDVDTGAVVAVTLQGADKGDTATLDETLCEAGMAVAEQVGREAELRPHPRRCGSPCRAPSLRSRPRSPASLGLVRGEWVAVDGSKFRAVSSVASVREREAVKRYLEALESADQEEELVVEPSKVADALKKLRGHREPEAYFMRATSGAKVPAYNVQAAVDSQHALIVAQQVTTEATDNRCLLPMAEAAQAGGEWSGTSVACGRRCRLFQRRTGGSLRRQRHSAARACQSRREQSGRRKTV